MIENTCSGTKTGKIERKMGGTGLAAFFLLILGTVLAAAGQTAPLPKAESLLDAFVEKSGGRLVFDKIANRRTTSTMKLSVLPAPGEVTTILTKAGPFRVVVVSPAIGKVEFGSDGRVVWEINPMTGPKIYEGLESRRFQFLYGLDHLMRWREIFKRVESSARVSYPLTKNPPSKSKPFLSRITLSSTISTKPRGFWSKSNIRWKPRPERDFKRSY